MFDAINNVDTSDLRDLISEAEDLLDVPSRVEGILEDLSRQEDILDAARAEVDEVLSTVYDLQNRLRDDFGL